MGTHFVENANEASEEGALEWSSAIAVAGVDRVRRADLRSLFASRESHRNNSKFLEGAELLRRFCISRPGVEIDSAVADRMHILEADGR